MGDETGVVVRTAGAEGGGVERGAVGVVLVLVVAGAPSWLRRSSMGMRRWTWTSLRRPSSRWKRCSWR